MSRSFVVIFCTAVFFMVLAYGAVGYIVAHFIAKFW